MRKIAVKIGVLLSLAALLAAGFACSDQAKASPKRSKKARNKAKQEASIEKETASKNTATKNKAASKSPDDILVVQIDNGEPQVLRRSEIETLREELKVDYRAELKQYKEEKKAAEANNTEFDQPKPPRPKLRVSRTVLKTEAEAQSYIDKLAKKKKSKKKKARKKAVENP